MVVDVLCRKQDKLEEARAIFKDIVTKNIDYPEAIFELWSAFEHLHGSLDQLQDCLDRIERAQDQLNTRRAKEAAKAAYQTSQTAQTTEAANASTLEVRQQGHTLQVEGAAAVNPAMDTDEPTRPDSGRKRKSADNEGALGESRKKAKTGQISS